ncbi:MAG: hypothetical protein QG597_1528 [Actinomycetota bacterium]|nr:hypothetical protein [Actinomycetota bacterium]
MVMVSSALLRIRSPWLITRVLRARRHHRRSPRGGAAGTVVESLVPRHAHAHAVLTAPYYRHRIRDVLGENTADVLERDPQASAVLVQVLSQAHQGGWDPGQALRMAAVILPTVPVDVLPTALDTARTDTIHPGAGLGDQVGPVLAHRLAAAVETLTATTPARSRRPRGGDRSPPACTARAFSATTPSPSCAKQPDKQTRTPRRSPRACWPSTSTP